MEELPALVTSLELLLPPVVEALPHLLLQVPDHLVEDLALVVSNLVPTLKPSNKVLTGSVDKSIVNLSTQEVPTSTPTPSKLTLHGPLTPTGTRMEELPALVTSLELPKPHVEVDLNLLEVEDADVLPRTELTLVDSKVLSIGLVDKLTVDRSTLVVLTSTPIPSKLTLHGLLTLTTMPTAVLALVTLLALLKSFVEETEKNKVDLPPVVLVVELLLQLLLVL
jgi:hypothetical protein